MARRYLTDEQAVAHLKRLAEKWPSHLAITKIGKAIAVFHLDPKGIPTIHMPEEAIFGITILEDSDFE